MKRITTSLGEYKIYPNFIITTFNDAIDLGLDDAEEIITLMHENMDGDFGWISDKINSYSINPFLYSKISEQVKNIKCYCNVIYNRDIRDTTEIGRYHFPKNIKLKKYNSIQEAIIWTRSIVDSK